MGNLRIPLITYKSQVWAFSILIFERERVRSDGPIKPVLPACDAQEGRGHYLSPPVMNGSTFESGVARPAAGPRVYENFLNIKQYVSAKQQTPQPHMSEANGSDALSTSVAPALAPGSALSSRTPEITNSTGANALDLAATDRQR